MLPDAAVAAKLAPAGEMENEHEGVGEPAWLTLKVMPPAVIIPLRGVELAFADTEKFTVPLPVPLAPDVTVIQGKLLTADHMQPADAFTPKLPAPPPAPSDALPGLSENEQVCPA